MCIDIKANKQPSVSIVIPMRNEEKYIRKCIESFIQQDYPKNHFEIIIVDGCSKDRSPEIVNELKKSNNNIYIIKNKKKITPVALNLGVKRANGDIIIIFSSHGFAEKSFISNNVKVLTANKLDCVGGTINTIGETSQSKAISLAQSSIFGVGNSLFRFSNKAQYVDTVAFGAYSKDLFNKIGYFDETLVRNQDFEFNHRIIKNGGKILLDPAIKSNYYARSSILKLFKQYFNYGYWKVRVVSKHKDAFKFRYQVPSLFVLSLMLFVLLSLVNTIFIYMLMVMIFIYFFVLISASFYISIRSRFIFIFILPLAFCALHFGFGLGFTYGSFRYLSKKVMHIILGKK